jgi:hypothetical protein
MATGTTALVVTGGSREKFGAEPGGRGQPERRGLCD